MHIDALTSARLRGRQILFHDAHQFPGRAASVGSIASANTAVPSPPMELNVFS
jgi:hypothetical protein